MRNVFFSMFLTLCLALFAQVSTAQSLPNAHLDSLFEQLATANDDNWEALEDEIWAEWSQSGSAAMDLLLDRGRSAMQAGEYATALEHLTALTDHAPLFAEGWNARATVFFQLGEFGLAIEDIAKTLALEPRHFASLSGLGVILEELNDPKRALEAFRHALAIHPQKPDIKDAVARLQRRAEQAI